MKHRTEWFCVLLVAAAFLLRFFHLASNPAGLFRDEADKGYTSYCLLETGQDQAGKAWPFFVQAMSVTTSAVYQYLDLPFIATLGLTETAVRLPACLAGTASVLIGFLLARRLWGTRAGLWAGLFVCLSPWSLLLSRWANQSILLTVSIPLGVYLFIRERERHFPSPRHALFAALCFLVALYTYAPARLFIPVFVVLLWLVSISPEGIAKTNRQRFGVSLGVFFGVFLVGSLPLAYHLFYESAASSARLSRITIFDGQPLLSLCLEWIHNYLLHFSPAFLFGSGDENLRHNTAVFGQLHVYLLPLWIAGIVKAVRCRSRIDRILLTWLLCFPLAAACTRERIPHALRSVFAVPVFHVVAAYGMVALQEWKSFIVTKTSDEFVRLCKGLWITALLLCTSIYLFDLFFRYPVYSAIHWDYGNKEAVTWWIDHKKEADRTVVTGLCEYPYVPFLFYSHYPPQRWINDQRIEGVEFMPTGTSLQQVQPTPSGRTLYLLRPEELPMAKPDSIIRLPSGEIIWKWIVWDIP